MNMSMPGYKGEIDWSFPLGLVMQPLLTTMKTTFLIPIGSDGSCLEVLQFGSALRHIRTLVGLPDSLVVDRERRLLRRELELAKESVQTLQKQHQDTNEQHKVEMDALMRERDQFGLELKEKQQELLVLLEEQRKWQEERKRNELEKETAGMHMEQQARWELERERFQQLLEEQKQRFQLDLQVAKLQETKTKTEKALVEEQLRLAQTQKCID
jgi:hypothetical protein